MEVSPVVRFKKEKRKKKFSLFSAHKFLI